MKRWNGWKVLISVICILALFPLPVGTVKAAGLSVNAQEVSLYALDDGYSEQISIPAGYDQSFQLQISGASQTPSFFIKEGNSVKVSAEGLITPATTTWYWNGNIGSTVSSGAEGERVVVNHNFGTSVIGIQSGTETVYVTVTVHNYATIYADEVMKQYIKENITDEMTDLEKLKKIAAFPAQYDYSTSYSGYTSMIIFGGGDCWASTSAILQLCEMTGLKAHLRYAANDPGAGSGHRNVAVQIGDLVYIAEAGYAEKAPRYYSVTEENTGFCYYVSQGKARIAQYDGFETDITVPSELGGFPVTEIGANAFYYGERYSGVVVEKIELPDTIEKIGESAFNSCQGIKEIQIPASVTEIGDLAFVNCTALENIFVKEGNASYTDMDGVLFNAEKTRLLEYPAGKTEKNYRIPEGVEELADYAFYYTKGVQRVVIPDSVKQIGIGAFGDSKVNWICFAGDMPEMGQYAFRYCTLTLYYPEKNATWNKEENYGAFSIDWRGYTDLETVLKQLKIMKGDCDGDGKIAPIDALIILKYIVDIPQDDFNMEAADCDGSPGITTTDALTILKHIANIISLI